MGRTVVAIEESRGFGPAVWAMMVGVNIPDSHGCSGGGFASYLYTPEALEDEERVRANDSLRPGYIPIEEFSEDETLYARDWTETLNKLDDPVDRIQTASSEQIANAVLEFPELLPVILIRAGEFGGKDKNGRSRGNEIRALLVEAADRIADKKMAIQVLSVTEFDERGTCYTALRQAARKELAHQRGGNEQERGYACGILKALNVDPE